MAINFFNTSFYDKESGQYSGKRYNKVPETYTQFFFQKRLRKVLFLVGKYAIRHNEVLIEDGCADGVVAEMITKKYPTMFSKVIGTDISPGMITEAQKLHPGISFYLKNELPGETRADLILAVGFVSPGIFEDEFRFIKEHLKENGRVVMSLVNRTSIHAKLKLQGKPILEDYWTFSKYEKYLKKEFVIIDSVPYGLFVPKLWAVPVLARALQPIFEIIFKLAPSLFHETLYVLEYKR